MYNSLKIENMERFYRDQNEEIEVEELEKADKIDDTSHGSEQDYNREEGEGNVSTQIGQLDVADRGDHGLGSGDTVEEFLDDSNIKD